MSRRIGDLAGLQLCLSNQAVVRLDLRDYRGSLKLYDEAESLCRRLGDRTALLTCLSNQALARVAAADFDGAMDRLNEKERLCRERNDRAGLAEARAEQGWIIGVKLGMPEPGLRRLIEAADLAEASGSPELRRRIATMARDVQRPK